jgi:hypothetical protein
MNRYTVMVWFKPSDNLFSMRIANQDKNIDEESDRCSATHRLKA